MIERIEALIEKATPGPWARDGEDSANFGVRGAPPDGNILAVVQQDGRGGRWDDALFIAQARQLLPLMLEVVKAGEAFRRGTEDLTRSGRLNPLRFSLEKLDAYCAEHLPESE